jgi:anti-sigma B factor antagonist
MNSSVHHEGDAIVLKVEGELDALTAPHLRPVLEDLLAASPKKVTVDLSSLRLIDSSGVGAIVSLFKRQRAAGGEFEITGLAGQPLAIFKVLRLDRVLSASS